MDGNFTMKLDLSQNYRGGLKIEKCILNMWHPEVYLSKYGEFVRI